MSIRGVAERVGVTPPSIYRHFADKGELLLRVCDVQFARLYEALAAGPVAEDPIEELRRQALAYVHFAVEHPEHYRLMLLTRLPLDREAFNEAFFDSPAFELLRAGVRRLLSSDDVRPEVLELGELQVALHLWSVVHGIASLMVSKPLVPWPPIDEFVSCHVDVVTHGLFTEARRTTGRAARPRHRSEPRAKARQRA